MPSNRMISRRPAAASSREQRPTGGLARPPGRQTDARRRGPHPTCDFCRSALTRAERQRLVWDSAFATELILAEVCGRCATETPRLLELYGGRGRNAITLVREVRASAPPRSAIGFVARGALYLLVAVTFFLIATLVSSGGR
jgi:hypothetical protein